MAKFKIRDKRIKERFQVDDEYINGMARYLDPHATVVYLSLCRHANFNTQKSFPRQETIAEQHNISLTTVKNKIRLLKIYNIVQAKRARNEEGKFKHNIYILMDKSVWKYPQVIKQPMDDPQVIKQPMDKHVSTGNQVATNVTNNTNVTNIKKIYKRKYSNLDSLSEKDFIELSDYYQIPVSFVRSKYDDLINYCESSGKKYKDYRAALRSFVKKDIEKTLKDERKGGVAFYE